jgi:hypothetical protein
MASGDPDRPGGRAVSGNGGRAPSPAGRARRGLRSTAAVAGPLSVLLLWGAIGLDAARRTFVDPGSVDVAVRASGARDVAVERTAGWMASRVCPGFDPRFVRRCKDGVYALIGEEISDAWFVENARGAHAVLLAFLEDGRDRPVAEIEPIAKRVRMALWTLWTKAGRPEPESPFYPGRVADPFPARVAEHVGGLPPNFDLAWLMDAAESMDDRPVPPATRDPGRAATLPVGRALRDAWRWATRLRLFLPAAALVCLALALAAVRTLPARMLVAGLVLAAAGVVPLAAERPLLEQARRALDRALLPPPPTYRADGLPDGKTDLARARLRARDETLDVMHRAGTALAARAAVRLRRPALFFAAGGAVLLLGALLASRPWRRRPARPRRLPLDSLPPSMIPIRETPSPAEDPPAHDPARPSHEEEPEAPGESPPGEEGR